MPTRGSFGPSSSASGVVPTKSISACTSRASKSGELKFTMPPDPPMPRGSQVSVL
jgi:hypothetical protein